MKYPGNDLDMVSCSFNHEEEIFMNKDKNSRADSALSATISASAEPGADTSADASAPEGNPGDPSSPFNEFNAVRETASVSERERCLEEKNKLLEEEVIKLKVELEKSEEQARKAQLKAFALDTLIQVADETYGFDLKKNFGSKR